MQYAAQKIFSLLQTYAIHNAEQVSVRTMVIIKEIQDK
jgi:hypothetical protein